MILILFKFENKTTPDELSYFSTTKVLPVRTMYLPWVVALGYIWSLQEYTVSHVGLITPKLNIYEKFSYDLHF